VGLLHKFLGRRAVLAAAAIAFITPIGVGPLSDASPAAAAVRAHAVQAMAAPPSHRTSTTSLGGLSVTLTVRPWRAAKGAVVHFEVSVSDSHANGALGYIVEFGDGSSAAPVMPMYCLAVSRPAHQSWQLSHRYLRAGNFKATASGFSNCGSGRVRAIVNVQVV
jgi:hypothetical protein